MPEKRWPAIAARAVWEKITKGQAGITWDNAIEKMWKESGRDQEEVQSMEKFGGYKKEEKRGTGKCCTKNKGERGEARRNTRGVEGRHLNQNISARPNGLREKLILRFRVGDLNLPERGKRYNSSREEEDVATHMCP